MLVAPNAVQLGQILYLLVRRETNTLDLNKKRWYNTNMKDLNEIPLNIEKVYVFCRNYSNGSPTVNIVEVPITENDYDMGYHYDRAITATLIEGGFDGPYFCIDTAELPKILQALNARMN